MTNVRGAESAMLGCLQAAFTVLLGGVSIVDFNAQRQAAFLQVTAGFMGISQTLLKFSSMNGIAFNSRSAWNAADAYTCTCLSEQQCSQ